MDYRALIAGLVLMLAGCTPQPEKAPPAPPDTVSSGPLLEVAEFKGHGRIVSITPSGSHVVLDHGVLEGFMDAMTMPFQLASPDLVTDLAPGDSVRFTLETSGNTIQITRIVDATKTTVGLGPAPDFALPDLEGTTRTLDEWAGQVVVLNFWATWCGPCKDEIPEFIRLQDELGPDGVQFVGIALDEEGAPLVRPFSADLGINYPILLDDTVVSEAYRGHYVVPTTYIIDRQGHMRHRYIGAVTFETLEPMLRGLATALP